MTVRPGDLDTKIIIEQQSTTQDPTFGTDVVTWSTLATVWAQVQDVMPSKAEGVVAGGVEIARNPTRIRLRWLSSLTSKCRIRLDHPRARTLQIIGGPADIGGRRNYMEILCEEISS
jgi:SPP1 family predicted phage head-tail adaptor